MKLTAHSLWSDDLTGATGNLVREPEPTNHLVPSWDKVLSRLSFRDRIDLTNDGNP